MKRSELMESSHGGHVQCSSRVSRGSAPAEERAEQRSVEALWLRDAALELSDGHAVLAGGAEQRQAARHRYEHRRVADCRRRRAQRRVRLRRHHQLHPVRLAARCMKSLVFTIQNYTMKV